MNRYLDGWCCEESIVYVLSISEGSIKGLQKTIDEFELVHCDSDGDEIDIDYQLAELKFLAEKINKANDLYEALKHQILIAIENEEHILRSTYCQMGFILPEDVILETPQENTLIELYRYETGSKTPIEETKFKKDSLAIWLYTIGEETLSNKVSPNLNVRELLNAQEKFRKENSFANISKIIGAKTNGSDSLKTLFEADETPSFLYWAYDVFLNAWHELPSDMKKPTKEQLTIYLKAKGLSEIASIEAIIKVSTPDKFSLGGKQKPELKNWKPKNERN